MVSYILSESKPSATFISIDDSCGSRSEGSVDFSPNLSLSYSNGLTLEGSSASFVLWFWPFAEIELSEGRKSTKLA